MIMVIQKPDIDMRNIKLAHTDYNYQTGIKDLKRRHYIMLQNPIFIEHMLKESQRTILEEAKTRQQVKIAKQSNKQKQFFNIEIVAHWLIYFGEHLKRRYCSKTTIAANP